MPAETVPPPVPERRPGSALRRLDGRTVAISVLIALIAALAAGLLVSVLHDDGASNTNGTNSVSLTRTGKVDTAKALGTKLIGFDGRSTTLSSRISAGTPAVVNFFSTTCGPCVREMAAFERVHQARHDVSFIGIDVQDSVSAGRGLIKRTGVTYEALRDPPGDLLGQVGGVGLPTTLVIDRKGRIVATHTGALTEQSLGDLLRRKLG